MSDGARIGETDHVGRRRGPLYEYEYERAARRIGRAYLDRTKYDRTKNDKGLLRSAPLRFGQCVVVSDRVDDECERIGGDRQKQVVDRRGRHRSLLRRLSHRPHLYIDGNGQQVVYRSSVIFTCSQQL